MSTRVIINLTNKEYTANLYRFRVERIEKQYDIKVTGVALLTSSETEYPYRAELLMSDEDRFTYLMKAP